MLLVTRFGAHEALVAACDFIAGEKARSPDVPMVASMSLGGPVKEQHRQPSGGMLLHFAFN